MIRSARGNQEEGAPKITNAGSPEETRKLGREFGQLLLPGDVVALYGDLGSGKTTFVQGLAKGLGIDNFVTSPSFVIINEYHVTKFKTDLPSIGLYHIDMYRLSEGADIEDLGLDDYFNKGSIAVIEWAERIPDILPKNTKRVYFEFISENERKIDIRQNK